MKTCFYIKYKGEVENDNLPLFKEFVIKDFTGSVRSMRFDNTNAGSIKVVGDANIYTDGDVLVGKELNFPASGLYKITSSSESTKYDIIFTEKYQLGELFIWPQTDIETAYFNTDEIAAFSSLKKVASVAGTNTISGNAELLNNLDLTAMEINNPNLYGDIAVAFGNMINLSVVTAQGSHLTGSIESFVVAQRRAGRDSATLAYWDPNVEIAIFGAYVTFDGGYAFAPISWQPNSNNPSYTDVTCRNKTITIDSNGNKIS